MNKFDIEFVMEMFLDSDSVTTLNRTTVAVADVVTDQCDNIATFTELLKNEHPQAMQVDEIVDLKSRRNKMFYEETVLKYTEDEYWDKFKMKKSTVQLLLKYLKDFVKPTISIVPLDKKLHIFLWLVVNDASYNEMAILFNLHKSSVAYIFHELASLLAELRYSFISWPATEEQHMTRIKVNSRFKFPNCVGFIDACRLKVGSKRNKKNQPDTILLQAVCDESLTFIDVYVSDVGISKKSKVFKESQLSQELKTLVDFDNHILGDSDYKLRKNLITPFTSEEVLTTEEMKFNEIHWKAHSYIGHAFELLKERFRKLNHIDINKPNAVKALLYAACVLHNFVLQHEGCPEIKEEPVTCDDGVTIDPFIVENADEKRKFLCNYINYIDAT